MTSVSYNFSTLMSTKCSKRGRWSTDAGPLDFGSSQELEQQMDLRGVPRHRFLLLGEIPGGGTFIWDQNGDRMGSQRSEFHGLPFWTKT